MKKTFLPIILFFISSVSAQTNIFPKWEKGFLDIHFINTGRGNAAFYLLPDGSSLLVDVGDLPSSDSVRRSPAVPNNSKTPAEWVADYIYHFHPDKKNARLDYALITHYHDDHFGHFNNSVKTHKEGNYKLSGITELGSIIPIKKLIDRGFDKPVNFRDSALQNKMKTNGEAMGLLNDLNEYWKFIEYQGKINGMVNEKFEVGSVDQIKLKNDSAGYPEFRIKNLFANGEISNSWDGEVSVHKYKAGEYPGENDLSCGVKISYGKFDLYTGGDIPGINFTGSSDFNSMEALVAPVVGPVDVATLNHHGNRDSQNEFYVRTIRPRVWIGQSWTSNHPGEEVLRRIISNEVYPGKRDLFTNFFHPSNKIVIGKRAVESYKTQTGHIVIRVYPRGDNYDIFVLDDRSDERKIISQYHYQSR
jgi:beta-lactamase superfamily II metal-dependent hydrolase